MGAVCAFFVAMRFTTRKIALCGIAAGLYAAITLLTSSFAYGPVQFRVAEALSVLCCFEPTLVVGITLGCFVSNIFSTVSALDMIFGTLATLLASLCMTKCRRMWQTVLPNVVLNGLIIGALIAWTSAPDAFLEMFLINGAQVAVGELAVMLVLGLPLYGYLKKSGLVARLLGQ